MGVLETTIQEIVQELFDKTKEQLESVSEDEQLDILNNFKSLTNSASNIVGSELEKRGFNLKRMRCETFEWACDIFRNCIRWKLLLLASYGYSKEEIGQRLY